MGTICIYYRQCPYFDENCYKGDASVAIEYDDCKLEKGAENGTKHKSSNTLQGM